MEIKEEEHEAGFLSMVQLFLKVFVFIAGVCVCYITMDEGKETFDTKQ